MRRVLIVSPNFPPINAADHQRVRMSLPYFSHFGWQPFVLAVDPRYVEGVSEPLLEQLIPNDTEVTRTPALSLERSRKFGLGNLGFRSLPYLHRAGTEIIKRERIDLVYFSTTMFPVMSLGRIWRKRFGVPYVLDFQDPWLSDYYQRPEAPDPPGGWLKYGISQAIARFMEPFSLRGAKHAISVSPAYPKKLLQRYSWLRPDIFTVLPFGASEIDFELLPKLDIKQSIFDAEDGKTHWVYVGRGGADMAFALRGFFQALQRARIKQPIKFANLRLHFVGTDYASGNRAKKTVEPVAAECGIADIIEERTERIPYFEALKCLIDADALMVFGSDDSGYTASKIYPYILARKPLLAVFHEKSSVVDLLRKTNSGFVATFADGEDTSNVSRVIETNWFGDLSQTAPTTIWKAFEPFSAAEMTRKQCEVFNNCLDSYPNTN